MKIERIVESSRMMPSQVSLKGNRDMRGDEAILAEIERDYDVDEFEEADIFEGILTKIKDAIDGSGEADEDGQVIKIIKRH